MCVCVCVCVERDSNKKLNYEAKPTILGYFWGANLMFPVRSQIMLDAGELDGACRRTKRRNASLLSEGGAASQREKTPR